MAIKKPGANLIQPVPNANSLPGQAGGMSPDAMGALGMGAGAPPMSPPGAPAGAPPDMGVGAPGMITPDQKAELDQLFGQVKGANSQLATKQLVSNNELSNIRQQLLGKMFELMQGAGVNPGDPLSVRSFLEELDKRDPDLLKIFTDAFQIITDQVGGGMPPAPEAGLPLDPAAGSTPSPEMGAAQPDLSGGLPPMPGQQDQGMAPLTKQFQNLQAMQ